MTTLTLLAAALVLSTGTFAETAINRPAFIKLEKAALQSYLELAKERHAKCINDAKESYYHGSGAGGEIDAVQTDTHALTPPSTWSLPDFGDELSTSVKVTKGAKSAGEASSSTTPLFSQAECRQLIDAAESHFEGSKWSTLPSGQYNIAGFWIKSVPAAHEWFNKMLEHRLFPLLKREFPDFVDGKGQLVVDNAYIFKYTPETGRQTNIHTDSGCLSFTIAVGGDFEGGGTWIEGAGTIMMDQGHVTVRPGGVRHAGKAVTKGERYVIGGFCMHSSKIEYARMLIGLGAELFGRGDLVKAREALEAAICINPRFDGAYTHLAMCYEKLNDKATAKEALEYCLHHVNPRNGETAYTLGMYYFDDGAFDDATKCLETCVDVDGNDIGAMMALAQICQKQQDTEKEGKWYQRIVGTSGAAPDVLASAYSNLAALNEGDEAEILFLQKASSLAPTNFKIVYSLGCAYATRQEWNEAAKSFRSALDCDADDAEISKQALTNLYKVAMNQVKQGSPNGFASREEMIGALQDVMGKELYDRLAGSR